MEFREWLQSEIDKREWSLGDLSRKSGVSRGALGNILRREREAGPEVCLGIARALKISPEQIFRRAGLLPAVQSVGQEISDEMAYVLGELDVDDQAEVLRYAQYRLQTAVERGKSKAAKNSPGTVTGE